MTIAEARGKCKSLAGRVPRDAVVVAVIVLASSASFGLGFLAGRDAGQGSSMGVVVEETNVATVATSSITESPTGQPVRRVVASKNGTKYYLPDCAGADRISDANKVWFVSGAAALKAGYEPAANCKGL